MYHLLKPALFLLACILLWHPGSVVATDYYVTPAGDDTRAGTSAEAAWRSIDRLNQTTFRPGDRILFQAKASFPGNLRLTAEDAGQPKLPVTITSFGEGQATILAGKKTGISVESAGHVVLSNLVVQGAGAAVNKGRGILCDNLLEGFQRLRDLRIENVAVSGFGLHGIVISGARAGYEGVRVTRCKLFGNRRGGMEIAGRLPEESPEYAHADVRVSHCDAHDNPGDPNFMKNHSGSGIVLYQVDGGVMEHCRAWGNCGQCRSGAGGGVGLWTCASRRVVIQFCESFANQTGKLDGGGFDLDGGCVECVLQFNYSHDNAGPGLMAYTYSGASHADRDNVIRFNISDNDSRQSRTYAGIWVRNDNRGMTGLKVYGNLVRIGPWADQAVYVHGGGVEAHFHHNLMLGSGAAVPLKVEESSPRLRFERNFYGRTGEPFELRWDGKSYPSLQKWREATGQEPIN